MRKSDVAVLLDIDKATSQILGWSASEMVGRTSLEFIHPDDQTLAVENWMQMLGSHGPGRKVRLRHKCRDGSWIWLEMTNHNLLDDPDSNCIIAEMVDISSEVAFHEHLTPKAETPAEGNLSQQPLRLHEAIRAREQLLHRLAEALPLGVLQSDAEGRIIYTNQKLHTILSTDRLSTIQEQLSLVLPDERERVEEALEATLRGGLDSDLEVRLKTSSDDGEKDIRQCTMSLRALTSASGEITGVIACIVDVTESVRIREELRLRATFDEVTRCHNRASTMEVLELALANSDNAKGQPAVIFVDLDRFKEINDRFGHASGDELLGVVAKRLISAVRRVDLVGRIGGDEFLVVCPGITTSAQAMQTAERIADTLRHQVRLRAERVPCRASIGVAWVDGSRVDADTLVSQADAAMYEAKRLSSGRPVLYAASRMQRAHGAG